MQIDSEDIGMKDPNLEDKEYLKSGTLVRGLIVDALAYEKYLQAIKDAIISKQALMELFEELNNKPQILIDLFEKHHKLGDSIQKLLLEKVKELKS